MANEDQNLNTILQSLSFWWIFQMICSLSSCVSCQKEPLFISIPLVQLHKSSMAFRSRTATVTLVFLLWSCILGKFIRWDMLMLLSRLGGDHFNMIISADEAGFTICSLGRLSYNFDPVVQVHCSTAFSWSEHKPKLLLNFTEKNSVFPWKRLFRSGHYFSAIIESRQYRLFQQQWSGAMSKANEILRNSAGANVIGRPKPKPDAAPVYIPRPMSRSTGSSDHKSLSWNWMFPCHSLRWTWYSWSSRCFSRAEDTSNALSIEVRNIYI